MEAELDTKDFVVIDNGTGYIKAGFSGEDAPRVVIPTILGQKSEKETGKSVQTVLGNQLNLKHPPSKMFFPIERGVIKDTQRDWEIMKEIWEFIIKDELQQDLSNVNVLVTDSILNSRENRVKIAHTFLETLGVNSIGIMSAPVLSLFSTGKTRGVVVEAGEGLTSIVPVFQGFALPHTIQNMAIAGNDITNYIQERLGSILTPHQFSIARGIKDQMMSVPLDYQQAMTGQDLISDQQRCYELPSGQVIRVEQQTRVKASMILFDPSIIDSSSPSLPELTVQSINKCDLDLRPDIYSNIILSGGTSMMKGFQDKLEREIKMMMSRQVVPSEIRFFSDSFRKHGAWIGGSMLASLSTFGQHMTITKSAWDTEGISKPAIVHKYSFQVKVLN